MSLDCIKIWKFKQSIRLDYSLVGFSGMKAKRRDISVIFNPTGDPTGREDVKQFKFPSATKLWLINRSKKHFTNLLVIVYLKSVF